jgi:hypothetical protein
MNSIFKTFFVCLQTEIFYVKYLCSDATNGKTLKSCNNLEYSRNFYDMQAKTVEYFKSD